MPEIIYKSKAAVAVIKPVGMPSQSDPSGAPDAMTLTAEKLAAMGEKNALWLVHRLDRAVGGVMVFARTKETAAALSAAIQSGELRKEYFAVAEGRAEGGEMRDLIFKDSASSKAFIVEGERRGAKLAVLEYTALDTVVTENGERTLVKIGLITGRFHQIRAQFSHRGMPLVGDGKYGSRDKGARTPALFSATLRSKMLNGGEPIGARPNLEKYPWSLFDAEKYR